MGHNPFPNSNLDDPDYHNHAARGECEEHGKPISEGHDHRPARQDEPSPALRDIVKRLVSIANGHTARSAGDHNVYELQLGERFIEEARRALAANPPQTREENR